MNVDFHVSNLILKLNKNIIEYKTKSSSLSQYNYFTSYVLLQLFNSLKKIDQVTTKKYDNLFMLFFCDIHKIICHEILSKNYHEKKSQISKNYIKVYLKKIIKIFYLIYIIIISKFINNSKNIYIIGGLTFDKIKLSRYLLENGIKIKKIKYNQNYSFPLKNDQYNLLHDIIKKIQIEFNFSDKLISSLKLKLFDHLENKLSKFENNFPNLENIDLVLTGSVADDYPRLMLLVAQDKNISTITLHHGGHYQIFDEIYQYFYEEVIIDNKIVYGHLESNIMNYGKNIYENKINYYSRIDNDVYNFLKKNNYTNIIKQNIKKLNLSKNIRVMYFPVCFGKHYYGPNLQIPNSEYFDWQFKMLKWVEENISNNIYIKPHPKRIFENSKINKYKKIEDINLLEITKKTDLLIIDYPTTSMAKLSVTNIPIIFFDLGLRNITNKAMDKIKERFIYIPISTNNFAIDKKILVEDNYKLKNYDYVNNYVLNNHFYNEEKRISDIIYSNFLYK
tara:strand:- start:601 stop:2115 length:1515 start_codon:yes stop_codon:yes gene_type:complete